jgi:hypothetical protein
MDESLFWAQVAAIGQVAGAAATFAAVLVSLWIAHSERRAHIKARCGLRLSVIGDGSPFEDVIQMVITNYGLRAVRVSSIGWRTGWIAFGPKWLKFQHAMQKFDHPISAMSLTVIPPFDLAPGQEVSMTLLPEPFTKATELRKEFFNREMPITKKLIATKVCLMVSLVAAKAVTTRVEKNLEHFLASGEIRGGAAKANAAADLQRARK